MKNHIYSTTRRTLLTSLATIIMALVLTMPSFGSGRVPLSGNTEDAVIQVGCASGASLPVKFRANYKNWSRDLSYDHNTTGCPIDDFSGERLPGQEGSGNFESVTYTTSSGISTTVERNQGQRQIQDVNEAGLIIIIIIDVYDYSGSLYVEITVIEIN